MPVPQTFVLRCPNPRCGYAKLRTTGFTLLGKVGYQRMRYAGSTHIGFLTRVVRTVFNWDDNLPMGTYHLYYCPVCHEEILYTFWRGMMWQMEFVYDEDCDCRLDP